MQHAPIIDEERITWIEPYLDRPNRTPLQEIEQGFPSSHARISRPSRAKLMRIIKGRLRVLHFEDRPWLMGRIRYFEKARAREVDFA